tara:strand:- start:133 stop:621 length:489 start_codon:yes stop_codon:yes gene_type:complete
MDQNGHIIRKAIIVNYHLIEFNDVNFRQFEDIQRSDWHCNGSNVQARIECRDKVEAGWINEHHSVTWQMISLINLECGSKLKNLEIYVFAASYGCSTRYTREWIILRTRNMIANGKRYQLEQLVRLAITNISVPLTYLSELLCSLASWQSTEPERDIDICQG